MTRSTEDIFETSSFASLIQQEEREEIIPLDLHTACLIGDEQVVRAFIEQKENLNCLNRGGWTPTMYASYVGRLNILSLLLEAGADVDIKSNKDGLTALMLASYCASEQIMYCLIQHGASVNSRDVNGMTSLFHAVRQGHQSAVKLLSTHNADLNLSQTATGISPIMEAAIAGYEVIFSTLLEHGADLRKRTKRGETLRSLAVRYGNQAVVSLLDKHDQPFVRTPREEPSLLRNTFIEARTNSNKLNVHEGPEAIQKKMQEGMAHDDSAIAAICPDFGKIGPYSATNESASHFEMSVGTNQTTDKDIHSVTDMNSFVNDNRHQKKGPIRFANEPPKQVFSSQLSQEHLLPVPKTLKEVLEEYKQEAFLPKFQQQGIDMPAFLDLTDNDLKDIGFDKLGRRKKLLNTIAKCKERLKVHGSANVDPVVHVEQLQAQIHHLNASLHEAYSYINHQKEQQMKQQHYTNNYIESERQRMRQIVYYTNDTGKNCKEAIGQMRKIKEFSNRVDMLLDKVKEHPNSSTISNELCIDNALFEAASSVKGEIEMALNRLDITFTQIERVLLIAQIDVPQQGNHHQPHSHQPFDS